MAADADFPPQVESRPDSRWRAVPRSRFVCADTPLLPAPGVAAALRPGLGLWIKADAWSGPGLGGNKVRKLEYELAPERLRGVTRIVTAGGPHSNHCRVSAALAARLGMKCTLVVNGEPEDAGRGNALLHRLLGARIATIGSRSERASAVAREAAREERRGGRALVVPVGASSARGTIGYLRCAEELQRQLGEAVAPPDARRAPPAAPGQARRHTDPNQPPRGPPDNPPARPWVFVSSSSGGTLGGLILGCVVLGWEARLVGVSPDGTESEVREAAVELAVAGAKLVAAQGPDPGGERRMGGPESGAAKRTRDGESSGGDDEGNPASASSASLVRRVRDFAERAVHVTDDFVGRGYGRPTPDGAAAISLFATRAGVVLDPVYTGKAAAGMIAWIREGRVPADAPVVFVHTGGHPALFR